LVDFEEMKERYPRGMIVLQGLWMLLFATILSLIFVRFLRLFLYSSNIDKQFVSDVFLFPPNLIPQPYNLIGLVLLPVGMILVIWANYALLFIGKIGLRAREPMRRPSSLVVVGPFRFTRNPIYLGCVLMLLGLVIVWSSFLTAIGLVFVYAVSRYVFIKREERILEEGFGAEYRDFKRRVGRWV
jgi:protein-S-isoprenylcysteine O-methyltransferase Ste14